MQETLVDSLGTEAKSTSQAIESAYDILGPVCKQRLFQHLQNNYGVEIWSATPSNLAEIKRAIIDLFGYDAATLLMKVVYAEIDTMET